MEHGKEHELEKKKIVRKTRWEDLDQVISIYEQARAFMRAMGNPHQWGENHPPSELIEEDIRRGKSYLCWEGDQILGVFYFADQEVDPTYETLLEGAWLNEEPYGVIHRIATRSEGRGVASFCVDWCLERCSNLRIDTHEDNRPMRHFLEKKGFLYCGVLQLSDGTFRLGYQRILVKNKNSGGDLCEQK